MVVLRAMMAAAERSPARHRATFIFPILTDAVSYVMQQREVQLPRPAAVWRHVAKCGDQEQSLPDTIRGMTVKSNRACVFALLLAAWIGSSQAGATQVPTQSELPQIDLAQLPRQGSTATYMGLVHQTIEAGKNKRLSKRSEQRLRDMQNRIALVLRQYQDINEIPPERRLRILESQRIIADILANARPTDWVCIDAPPTGSKLSKVQCATREDVETARRSSKSWTEHAQGLGRP